MNTKIPGKLDTSTNVEEILKEDQQLNTLREFTEKVLNDSVKMPAKYGKVFTDRLRDILA